MEPQNKTLEERASNLEWQDLLIDNGPDAIMAIYCAAFYLLTYKFDCVLRGARRLQRINLFLISITALMIIIRNVGLRLEYLLVSHWITYGVNCALLLISITDIFVLLSSAAKVIRLTVYGRNKPREHWIFAIFIATVLSSLVTLFTFELYPRLYFVEFFTVSPRSYIYGVFAILVSLASIACHIFFSYTEETLAVEWASENKGYVQLRHEFKNAKALAKQAGFNSALKAYAILSLMIWHKDQRIYHSLVLFYLVLTTTVCFFCHEDARYHVFHFLRMDRVTFFRNYLGAHKNSRYRVNRKKDFHDIFNAMNKYWENAFDEQHPKVVTPAAKKSSTWGLGLGLGFFAFFGGFKPFFNTIEEVVEYRKRRSQVNPKLPPV